MHPILNRSKGVRRMIDIDSLRAYLMDYIGSSYIPYKEIIVAEIESCNDDRLIEIAEYFNLPLN